MNIIVFRNVFRNSLLNKIIFKYVHHIFIDILKIKKTYKWNEVSKSRYILAGNGYLNQLKEYYRINNSDDLKYNRKLTVLLNAFKSKSLDIIKFIIEELHYDYNSHGCYAFVKNSQSLFYQGHDLLWIASKHGNIEIIQYIESLKRIYNKNNNSSSNNNIYNCSNWNYGQSFKVAPLSEDIKVLQFIYQFLEKDQINDKCLVIKLAIQNSISIGRIDMVEWLITISKVNLNSIAFIDENPISKAARCGHFEIIKWLHTKNCAGFQISAMNNASMGGHFEIVKWLHENRTEGCTTDAMDDAVHYGLLEIIKWLHENRTEGCTIWAMNNAASHGHLEIIKWLLNNRTECCTTKAMDNAASYGHLETIKWLFNNRTEGCTSDTIDNAASNGHFEIVEWLLNNQTECYTTNAMSSKVINLAAASGHLEIIRWFHFNRTESNSIFTTKAMDGAASNGHLGIVKWLHENRNECCTISAMDCAAAGGHLEIVKWIHEQHNRTEGDHSNSRGLLKSIKRLLHINRSEVYSTKKMDKVVKNGHLGSKSMDNAALNGHLEIIIWLHENRNEGCSINA